MFILQHEVPEYYMQESRDFQFLIRLWQFLCDHGRYQSTTALRTLDAEKAPEHLLPHLATRVGFFPRVTLPADALRSIISVFPYCIKNKGSRGALTVLATALLRGDSLTLSGSAELRLDRTTHTIKLYVQGGELDEIAFREAARYIQPIGWDIAIYHGPAPASESSTQT